MLDNKELKIININIDLKPIEDLITSVQTLKTLTDTQNWKNEALLEVENIQNHLRVLIEAKENVEKERESIKVKNIFKSFFNEVKFESNHKPFFDQLKKVNKLLNDYDLTLKYWINFTPDSKEELAEMKSELKEKKQFITIRKKELRLDKKEIWAEARELNAMTYFASYKLRMIDRGIITLRRENTLRPYDLELRNLELKQIEIEKVLNWLNKIK